MREGQKRPYKFVAVKNYGGIKKKTQKEKTLENIL